MRPEEIRFHERTHAKILVPTVVMQVLLLAAHIAVVMYLPRWGIEQVDSLLPTVLHLAIASFELVCVVVPLLQWWHSTFTITTHRIEQAWGVLAKHNREIPIQRITQVAVSRGLIDRLFGCGTLVLHDAGSDTSVQLHDVPHVRQARDLLDQLRFVPVG